MSTCNELHSTYYITYRTHIVYKPLFRRPAKKKQGKQAVAASTNESGEEAILREKGTDPRQARREDAAGVCLWSTAQAIARTLLSGSFHGIVDRRLRSVRLFLSLC